MNLFRTCSLALGLWGAATQAGCLGFAHHACVADLPEAATQAGMRRLEVNAGRYMGISDLAAERDPNGDLRLLILPERQRTLLQLEVPRGVAPGRSQELLATTVVAKNIEGVPPYADTESLAVLAPNTLAVGTETPWSDRDHDLILIVDTERHPAHVVAALKFPYAPYGLLGASNAGLEGICFAANTLLVASETTGRLGDGTRFAPLGQKTLAADPFVPLRLQLTSATGRISALTCRPAAAPPGGGPAVLEVLAIERNYGVSRILAFEVAANAAAGEVIRPRMALDLAPLLQPLRNYEGVAWLDSGDVLLVTDNSMGFATGPTEALLVPKAMLEAQPGPMGPSR